MGIAPGETIERDLAWAECIGGPLPFLAGIASGTDPRHPWLVIRKGGYKHFFTVPDAMAPAFSWLPDNRHAVIAPISTPLSGSDTGLFVLDTQSKKLSLLKSRRGPPCAPTATSVSRAFFVKLTRVGEVPVGDIAHHPLAIGLSIG